MKISAKILLINFTIVLLIIGSSAFAFYSIMFNTLTSQQSRYLLNSANDFVYSFREKMQESEYELIFLVKEGLYSSGKFNLSNNKSIDFIIETDLKKEIRSNSAKELIDLSPQNIFNIDEFLAENPFAIIKSYQYNNNVYYYGRVVTEDFLNEISKKINAEIAVIWENSTAQLSNENSNRSFIYPLNEIYRNLSGKNNFEIYSDEVDDAAITATIYRSATGTEISNKFEYVIFSAIRETADLRSSLSSFLVIIGFSGSLLAIILTLLFTGRMRKQITQLSDAALITKDGNFKNKIDIKGSDEIAQLASAFNKMLDDLYKHEKAKNEYSEFITLINQNASLKEISNVSLRKIIHTAGFAVGALYDVEGDDFSLISCYGFDGSEERKNNTNFFETALKNKETIELYFDENPPRLNTGVISIEIKYLLFVPIIYNNKVTAILELGSASKPSEEARDYLMKIQEQLAIGLTNAKAVVQLENFVNELKRLNDDYQKQNVQIRKQNETLIDLHNKLKEKADELEIEKEKAEESTQLKSQFLASMSHELRTPMNSILGLTELILEEPAIRGKNRERLDIVLRSGRRLMNLINDILDLSKIEAGKMEISEEDFLLDDMIHEIEASIGTLAQNKNLNFVVDKSIDTKIIINSDRNKITQVLLNLLGNAVKFTDQGYVTLKVYSGNENENLCFDIIDSGIGISEENQKLIFEEFRQIDGTTTRKYGGTGLGLTICQKIADLLHGTISLQSKVGSGSTFSFAVPLKFIRAQETAEGLKVNLDILRKNRNNPVLVIDDDPEVSYTIGQYLNSKGYEVIFAKDGETGVKEAVKHQPFAITLDVMLPNKDGWNVLKELKEHHETRDIPVIMVSILNDKNLGYGLGAFEYFVKPISSDKLLSAFNKLENLANKKIEKIVIVDDDELEFEKFKNEFKNEKIRINYIKDSELAFSKILEIQPDLIILDLLMPNVDGITLSHKLKSNRETKHIPVIISTAKDLSPEEKNSLNKIVEEITVKSKGHPLDVLKIVRDRLKQQENANLIEREKLEHQEDDNEIIVEVQSIEDDNKLGEVLIVDDDPDTLFTINEIVQAVGSKTMLAKNGIECLTVLEDKLPDLILLDIMMPELDGFQTIKRIRSSEKYSKIPVYAVTAKAMLDDKGVILRHGFDDYIAKPVNAGVLAFKIKRLFTKLNLT
jgi:signal transduction histidine kinase/DNA-binding response OmpR family regulator/HAMP domain-containing protein